MQVLSKLNGPGGQTSRYSSSLLDDCTPTSKVSVSGLFHPSQMVPNKSLNVFVECLEVNECFTPDSSISGTNMQQLAVSDRKKVNVDEDHKN